MQEVADENTKNESDAVQRPKKSQATRSMTEKQRKFAKEYVVCGDGEEAAKKAGYAAKTAKAAAKRLLLREDVQKYLQDYEEASKTERSDDCTEANECVAKSHETSDASLAGSESGEKISAGVSCAEEITQEAVVKELAAVGFASLKDVCKWSDGHLELLSSDVLSKEQVASIAEITETVTSRGGTVRVKLHSKLKALEMLAKHLGLYEQSEESSSLNRLEEISPVLRKKLETVYGTLPDGTSDSAE